MLAALEGQTKAILFRDLHQRFHHGGAHFVGAVLTDTAAPDFAGGAADDDEASLSEMGLAQQFFKGFRRFFLQIFIHGIHLLLFWQSCRFFWHDGRPQRGSSEIHPE